MSSGSTPPSEEHVAFSKLEKGTIEDLITDTQVGESHEIFQTQVNGVEFRTVSWQRATVVFVKIGFAMSILSIPGALATLGAVGGCLAIVGFTALNTCKCFRRQNVCLHARCYSTDHEANRHWSHLR